MKKSIFKHVIYLCCCSYALVASMLLFGLNANAYVDPSVMTYIIQVIAGIAVAVGAIVGVYWRRAKKKMQDALGIEEKKEHESDEIIIYDEAGDAVNTDEL